MKNDSRGIIPCRARKNCLVATFFQPAATQEGAAERLGLPFSTYRYHLARGEDRIVEWLWDLELSGSR